jgi:hypothetical protein
MRQLAKVNNLKKIAQAIFTYYSLGALRGLSPIRTNLTGVAHLIPYFPLPFFAFKAFRYLPVIFQYQQAQIGLQDQRNERRFTPYAAAVVPSDHRGEKKPSR